jgi:hypothetical protein
MISIDRLLNKVQVHRGSRDLFGDLLPLILETDDDIEALLSILFG